MAGEVVSTKRLTMRQFRPSDRAPFAALNADPAVMDLFPRPLSYAESDQLADRIEAHWRARGFGLWALEVKATGSFIGFTGLSVPGFQAAFTPAVEVGWRLARDAWGFGYATEAGAASLRFGFQGLSLQEIVSFTSQLNHRSRAVMERLGMVHRMEEDFRHPNLPLDHVLSQHVLYRISRQRWQSLPLMAESSEES
ncbi:MAG: GNAT family N-acetyltransferase [Candidatus Dormibacteria bacterium]